VNQDANTELKDLNEVIQKAAYEVLGKRGMDQKWQD
jgi:hypothetical protein